MTYTELFIEELWVSVRKQSFRDVLCTLIYISTFVPNLNFGQDEHKRRRQMATYV